jgi:hypothetical protein
MAFAVEETSDGILLRPTQLFAKTDLDKVVGCLKYKGKPKTIAQMDAGIRQSVMRRRRSGRY